MTNRRNERAMYSTELYYGMTFQHLTCPSSASSSPAGYLAIFNFLNWFVGFVMAEGTFLFSPSGEFVVRSS